MNESDKANATISGSRWFRMHCGQLYNRKAQMLPPPDYKHWINSLSLAGLNDGILPALPDIAFAFRMSEAQTQEVIGRLKDAGFIDETADGRLTPHEWAKYQYVTSTERTRRYRKLHKNDSETSQGTPMKRAGTFQSRNREDAEQTRLPATVDNLVKWGAFQNWVIGGIDMNESACDMILDAIEDRAPGFLEAEAKRGQKRLEAGHPYTLMDDFIPAFVAWGFTHVFEDRADGTTTMDDPRNRRLHAFLARATRDPSIVDPWPTFEKWCELAWAA